MEDYTCPLMIYMMLQVKDPHSLDNICPRSDNICPRSGTGTQYQKCMHIRMCEIYKWWLSMTIYKL